MSDTTKMQKAVSLSEMVGNQRREIRIFKTIIVTHFANSSKIYSILDHFDLILIENVACAKTHHVVGTNFEKYVGSTSRLSKSGTSFHQK